MRCLFRYPIRLGLLVRQIDFIGAKSVPVVIITGGFIGAVFAAQCEFQFRSLGMSSAVGPVVAIAMCRELGPVLCALMIAGRVGSAMAAELATMKITEQIDALRALAVYPTEYLIVPRFLGHADLHADPGRPGDLCGIGAGYYVAVHVLDVPGVYYWNNTVKYTHDKDIWIGVVKGFFFGLIILLVGCNKGLQASAGRGRRRPGDDGVGGRFVHHRADRQFLLHLPAQRHSLISSCPCPLLNPTPSRWSASSAWKRNWAARRCSAASTSRSAQGERMVIIGRSGGGKSVLLKHIIGADAARRGEVWFRDKDLAQLSEEQLVPLRKETGMLFQNGALFDSLTVGENVAFPLREKGGISEEDIQSEVARALKIVDLPNQEHKWPSELSGGMRKRVALARAAIAKPALMLYDEPTSGLDPVVSDSINKLMVRLGRRTENDFRDRHARHGQRPRSGRPHRHALRGQNLLRGRAGGRAGIEGPDRATLCQRHLRRQ